jgi:hypothetical protein
MKRQKRKLKKKLQNRKRKKLPSKEVFKPMEDKKDNQFNLGAFRSPSPSTTPAPKTQKSGFDRNAWGINHGEKS